MATTADKIKASAKEEVQEYVNLGKQAAMSGAYIYPIKGITHFISHPALQKPLLKMIVPTIALSIVVIITMFIVAYVPQVAVLVWVDGPVAVINGVLLVLSQSSTIILGISRYWWIEEAELEVFDAVLLEKGQQVLVAKGREIKGGNSSDPLSKLGKKLKKPFSSDTYIKAFVRYVMMLPLNFIPVVGTVIFIVLQARTFGPANHARYFQLKGFSNAQRQDFIKKNEGSYLSYGMVCVALNLIPLANVAFAFTNTVGAALWAADMETQQKQTMKKAT